MSPSGGVVFDPETINLIQTVLEDAWSSLPPERQACVSRTRMAERVLSAAAHGERDPIRLRARTLIEVAAVDIRRAERAYAAQPLGAIANRSLTASQILADCCELSGAIARGCLTCTRLTDSA
jgi:hypothetical protein